MKVKGTAETLRAVGLFSGIGGLEIGLDRAGIASELLCELDPAARHALMRGFPDKFISADVTKLRSIPKVDVVAAGFPCQNLSLVGTNEGIHGKQSTLVNEVFRLVSKRGQTPTWVVLENVPFMLWHKKGHAIRYVTKALEDLGFRWAYRVVETRAFGLPQRRRRVLIVASKKEDPRTVLHTDDSGAFQLEDDGKVPCGFSWTEGKGGLGWAVNAVPTLKAGSGVGIPSPPAIWMRSTRRIVTPNIRDAERLQGFPTDWTDVVDGSKKVRIGARWRMVGNAVSVPVAEWLGSRLVQPGTAERSRDLPLFDGGTWPNAAWGHRGKVTPVQISECPVRKPFVGLDKFLSHPTEMLSARASLGFLNRARKGGLRFAPGFLEAVEKHAERSLRADAAARAVA